MGARGWEGADIGGKPAQVVLNLLCGNTVAPCRAEQEIVREKLTNLAICHIQCQLPIKNGLVERVVR